MGVWARCVLRLPGRPPAPLEPCVFPDRPEPIPYAPLNVRDFVAAHGTASHMFGGPGSTDEFMVEVLTSVRDTYAALRALTRPARSRAHVPTCTPSLPTIPGWGFARGYRPPPQVGWCLPSHAHAVVVVHVDDGAGRGLECVGDHRGRRRGVRAPLGGWRPGGGGRGGGGRPGSGSCPPCAQGQAVQVAGHRALSWSAVHK